MRFLIVTVLLLGALTASFGARAQAMVPPTGMEDASKPMPMLDRMNRRFPQPVRDEYRRDEAPELPGRDPATR